MVVNDTNNTATNNTHFFHTVFPVTRSSSQKVQSNFRLSCWVLSQKSIKPAPEFA